MQATATAPTLEQQGTHALLATGLSVILGLTLSVIVARTLGPGGKGILDVTSATVGLFSLVLGVSLNAALTHHIARKNCIPAGLSAQLAVWGAAAALVSVGALGVRPELATRLGFLPATDRGFWIAFVAISVGFGIWAAGLRGMLIGRHALITANRIDLGIKVILLFGYVTLVCQGAVTPQLFALIGGGSAIVLAFTLLVAGRTPTVRVAGTWSALLAIALPVHSTNIVHFLNQRADVFFVQAFQGPAEVGLYVLAVSLAQIVLLVSGALAQPLLPRISAANSPIAAAEAAAGICRQFVVLALLTSVALAVGAPWFVPRVFGHDFSGSLPSLLILLPGMIAFGLTNILISYFVGMGRSATNLWISAATLLLTLAGNAWLTRRYGILGAALTSSLAYGLAGTLSVFFFARESRTSALTAVIPHRTDWRNALTLVSRFHL